MNKYGFVNATGAHSHTEPCECQQASVQRRVRRGAGIFVNSP